MESNANLLNRESLITPQRSYADVSRDVCRPLESFPTGRWYVCLMISLGALLIGVVAGFPLLRDGLGVLGINNVVAWGTFITNFVFWIGIGHAGTLISAILFLFRQRWRTAVNRSAEAMTIFAVMTAGIFPILHTGRPWYGAFWLFPYPNQRQLWVNFRSPLEWDVWAVSTYFTISLLFWYLGLIPDIASVRDRAKNKMRKLVYTILSFGWRGGARHWNHYEMLYLLLAALSTPLVLSVHSIVSFDFAASIIPGWHTTIFPPYFVAGAIFGGFAMVLLLLVATRKVFQWEDFITITHLENMNKVLLTAGMLVGYAYSVEFFTAWYSANDYEFFAFKNRAFGPYAWTYWTMIFCNVLSPQLFWFKRFRTSIPVMIVVAILVTIGMWFERFVIIVTSLHRDYLPSSWAMFYPTIFDIGIFVGSLGLFFTLYLIFVRLLPAVSMSEIKGVLKGAHPRGEVDDV